MKYDPFDHPLVGHEWSRPLGNGYYEPFTIAEAHSNYADARQSAIEYRLSDFRCHQLSRNNGVELVLINYPRVKAPGKRDTT